jgi:hypothetical protein
MPRQTGEKLLAAEMTTLAPDDEPSSVENGPDISSGRREVTRKL